MGVDYSANFGIGVEVDVSRIDENLCIDDYLDDVIEDSKYHYIK